MLNWLTRLFRRHPDSVPKRRRSTSSPVHVTLDDRAITVNDGTGSPATLLWADLANVAVVTTDLGPFETDLYWVLTDRTGRQLPAIPMDAEGEAALLHAMQARLSGFDNMAVVEAMGSVSPATFQIWPAAELT
jgi:hypothetical protein